MFDEIGFEHSSDKHVPDGEPLMFPGQSVISQINLLVDHLRLRRARVKDGGNRPQVLQEYRPGRPIFRRFRYVQLQLPKITLN